MKTKLFNVTSALALGLAMISTAVQAQEAPSADEADAGTVEEVVVTAQRRSETLSKVPASVEVVSGERLQAARISNLANLQDVSPSLTVTQGNNPSSSVFTVRGVGTAVTDRGFEQSVGVYIDGVFRGRPGAALQDLLDIDRVEVLRGPQSTLFGRNNAAGAVNIATSLPDTSKFGVYAEAAYGNYNTVQGKLTADLPLVADQLALRLSVASSTRDGYLDAPNLKDGDVNAQDRQSLRAQLYWEPSDYTRLRLIADYSEADNRCCGSSLLFVSDAAATAPFVFNVRGNFIGFTPPTKGTVGVSPSNPANQGTIYRPFDRVSIQDTPSAERTTDQGLSLQVDQDIGSLTLTGIVASRRFKSDLTTDIDGADSAMISTVSAPSTSVRENSAEVRLQNETGAPVEFVVGAYYFDQRIIDDNDVRVLIKPVNSTLVFYDSNAVSELESAAVFGQGTWNVTDNLRLTGGLRYLNETKSAVVTVAPGTFSFPGDIEIENDAWMGTAIAAYQATPDANLYLRYATGYKSAAINLLLTSNPATISPVADPETTESWEAGAKLRLFDGKMQANIAVYTQTVKDQQVQVFDSAASTFVTLNAAEVRSRGVEADVIYRVTQSVSFNLSASYLDAQYESFTNAPAPAGSVLVSQDLTGRTPAKAPRWTIVGGVSLDKPLTDDIRLRGVVNLRHASSEYADLALTEAFRNGETNLLSASAELAFGNGVGVQIWGRNLTDEAYYVSGAAVPSGSGSLAAYVNDPRTYGVTLRYRY